MKRNTIILAVLLTALLGGLNTPVQAQLIKEQHNEHNEMLKMTKNEQSSNTSKAARKEAKKLIEQGWMVVPGALPIDKQLDRSYNMQYMFDENLLPRYIMGEAISISENYDAAKMQALELAKQNLAGQIATEITALVENTVANNQLTAEQATSITQTVSSSKSLIFQSIDRVVPVVEVYRVKGNKNKEVLVRIAYSTDAAMHTAKKVIRDELKKKGENLQKQLDKLLDV